MDVWCFAHVWCLSIVWQCCKCCPHLCLIVTDAPTWCCTHAPRTPPTASSSSPAGTARCRESTNCLKFYIPSIVVGFKVSFEGIENYFVRSLWIEIYWHHNIHLATGALWNWTIQSSDWLTSILSTFPHDIRCSLSVPAARGWICRGRRRSSSGILTFLRLEEEDPETPGCCPDLQDSRGSQTCWAPRPPPETCPRHQQAAEDKKWCIELFSFQLMVSLRRVKLWQNCKN